MTKTSSRTEEQLAESKGEVTTLKKALQACMDAAKTDQSLLNSGLRLAMENAALRVQVSGLMEKKTKPADSKFKTSPHGLGAD